MTRRAPLLLLVLLSACHRNPMYPTFAGFGYHVSIFGTLLLIADLWACYHIWGARRGFLAKVLWSLLVLCFPCGGLIFFWLFGDRRGVT